MPSKQNNQGFTLIEILVVILIVGITLGFALLSFGDFGSKRRIVMAAEQFVNDIKLAQQQAILGTDTLGIHIDKTQYEVLRFIPPNHWRAMTHGFFRPQKFPENTIVTLVNRAIVSSDPQIIINASGDITPFKLLFSSSNEADIVEVVGEHNGNVMVQLAHEK
jgi:general secretion pathway protein H